MSIIMASLLLFQITLDQSEAVDKVDMRRIEIENNPCNILYSGRPNHNGARKNFSHAMINWISSER